MNLFKQICRKLFIKKEDEQPRITHVRTQELREEEPTTTTHLGTRHAEQKQVTFQKFQSSRPLKTKSEQWQRHGDSFKTTNEQTRIITANDRFVKPDELMGLCQICNDADKHLFICALTGIQLCKKCLKTHPHPDHPIPLSPEAHKQVLKNWNEWELQDYIEKKNDNYAAHKLFPFYQKSIQAWNRQ